MDDSLMAGEDEGNRNPLQRSSRGEVAAGKNRTIVAHEITISSDGIPFHPVRFEHKTGKERSLIPGPAYLIP